MHIGIFFRAHIGNLGTGLIVLARLVAACVRFPKLCITATFSPFGFLNFYNVPAGRTNA